MIEVYTDGSCLGNPGPMGGGFIAVQLDDAPTWCKGSAGFGPGTSNLAELHAIEFMLSQVPVGFDDVVTVYTDSRYAIDAIERQMRYGAHGEAVSRILKHVYGRKITFVKVDGHAGNVGNEIADQLAKAAARSQSMSFEIGNGTHGIKV